MEEEKQNRELTEDDFDDEFYDAEMLSDLILAAVNSALKEAEETSAREMGKLTGGMGGLF